MFTANSMNCLTEALGLSLPGNGTVLATHADRKELFLQAGAWSSNCAIAGTSRTTRRPAARHRHFEGFRERDDARHRDGRFDQHRPAPARRGAGSRVDFTMATSTGCRARCRACARWRPTHKYHIEDVHRAGGIMGILGELARAGLLHPMCRPCMQDPGRCDREVGCRDHDDERVSTFFAPRPAAYRPRSPSARTRAGRRWNSILPSTAASANKEHAYSQEGGLAVLYGNIASTAAS
jgi:dihydroxy-acid dehydratase